MENIQSESDLLDKLKAMKMPNCTNQNHDAQFTYICVDSNCKEKNKQFEILCDDCESENIHKASEHHKIIPLKPNLKAIIDLINNNKTQNKNEDNQNNDKNSHLKAKANDYLDDILIQIEKMQDFIENLFKLYKDEKKKLKTQENNIKIDYPQEIQNILKEILITGVENNQFKTQIQHLNEYLEIDSSNGKFQIKTEQNRNTNCNKDLFNKIISYNRDLINLNLVHNELQYLNQSSILSFTPQIKIHNDSFYIGQLKNSKNNKNKQDGTGVLVVTGDEDNQGQFYKGQFKNDTFCGFGIYQWGDGDRCEGQYENNLRQGNCVVFYEDDDIKIGNFDQDEWKGVCIKKNNEDKLFLIQCEKGKDDIEIEI